MSLVSVFVPCYNYGHFLEECLQSVLDQDGVDVEVLVIDDASTDDSLAVARKIADRDPRVQVWNHTVNQGHISTFNEGLAWGAGQYLLLLSADDFLLPGALSRAAAVLDRHPKVGFVYGEAPRSWEVGTSIRTTGDAMIVSGRAWLEDRCRVGSNPVRTATAVVRAELQRKVGGYLPEHPHAGDLEMWLRLSAYADVAVLPTHQAVYREHETNMSKDWYLEAGVRDLQACRQAFDEVIETHGSVIGDADRLRLLARRACARRMVGRASTVYDSGLRRPDYVRALIDLAFDTDRGVWRTSTYWKFRVKSAMGYRASTSLARRRRRSVNGTRNSSFHLDAR